MFWIIRGSQVHPVLPPRPKLQWRGRGQLGVLCAKTLHLKTRVIAVTCYIFLMVVTHVTPDFYKKILLRRH